MHRHSANDGEFYNNLHPLTFLLYTMDRSSTSQAGKLDRGKRRRRCHLQCTSISEKVRNTCLWSTLSSMREAFRPNAYLCVVGGLGWVFAAARAMIVSPTLLEKIWTRRDLKQAVAYSSAPPEKSKHLNRTDGRGASKVSLSVDRGMWIKRIFSIRASAGLGTGLVSRRRSDRGHIEEVLELRCTDRLVKARGRQHFEHSTRLQSRRSKLGLAEVIKKGRCEITFHVGRARASMAPKESF